MKLLLAPHNDDETLFAAFICLTERPHVVVCLRSYVQERRGGPSYGVREAETERAMEVLGCTWTQLDHPDDRPDWDRVASSLKDLDESFHPEMVYAPAQDWAENGWSPDEDIRGFGLYHHDRIGMLAQHVFGDRVKTYHTYSRWNGRTVRGMQIHPSPQAVIAKLAALRCYQSQIDDPSTRMHFLSLQEYVE